ncbi:MAG: shikimate kinase [Bacteroidales bacterium]|nr:shikimate kinase [Bacteroidales bacterium]
MRIVLVGYMGSGKSTAGKKLASHIGFSFLDIDHFIEEKYKISIHDFFKKYGEDVFRKIESDVLKNTLIEDNIVISTGGGTPCFKDNMNLINKNSYSVYIKMNISSIENRLINSKKSRPLLKEISQENLNSFIEKQLLEREKYYNQAHLIVKGENLDLNYIIESFENFRKRVDNL